MVEKCWAFGVRTQKDGESTSLVAPSGSDEREEVDDEMVDVDYEVVKVDDGMDNVDYECDEGQEEDDQVVDDGMDNVDNDEEQEEDDKVESEDKGFGCLVPSVIRTRTEITNPRS